MSNEEPLVLVVEDEPDLADLYATWLSERYEVRTAYGGREAIEKLDDRVDVILLDRRMPDLPGDEVLEVVRDRGIDSRVAMVTAVEPDFDIIAMGFDDYLVKPVSKDALRDTVESLLLRDDYDEGVGELFSLASKKALIESEKSTEDLEENEEYQQLTERITELRSELDATLQTLDTNSDVTALYRELGRKNDENGG
jgi:DNA-binding response OmpR family regulator